MPYVAAPYGGQPAYHAGGGSAPATAAPGRGGGYQAPPVTPQQAYQTQAYGYQTAFGAQPVAAPRPYHAGGGGGGGAGGGAGGGGGGQWRQQQQPRRY